jgi:LysR family glycine cleavage system transcriptional activator
MKAVSRLPLNALRVFEAVARTGSMARAAELLSVQPSAVSMQIKNLTDYVGLPLVARVGKRVELTPHGQALLAPVLSGLGQIEEAVHALRRSAAERPFTVSVLPAFLHLWLLPRLPEFQALYPQFDLRVVVGRELVDPAQGEVDAAVRLGAGRWPGVHAQKLMDEELVPVCAPSLRRKVGSLAPGELPRGVPLLQTSVDPWTQWSPAAAKARVPAVAVDDAVAVVQAAKQGKGVALVRTTLVQSALAAGELVAVGRAIPYRWSYYWVCLAARRHDPQQRILFDWLRTAAGLA